MGSLKVLYDEILFYSTHHLDCFLPPTKVPSIPWETGRYSLTCNENNSLRWVDIVTHEENISSCHIEPPPQSIGRTHCVWLWGCLAMLRQFRVIELQVQVSLARSINTLVKFVKSMTTQSSLCSYICNSLSIDYIGCDLSCESTP